MLSLFGRLVRLFKKDIQILANYERSHPHFFWILGIDAVLSVSAVLGGYTFYAHSTSDLHQLQNVGASVLTSGELTRHVNDENVDAYWLGPIPGYEYTMSHSKLGIAELFYWRKGSFDIRSKEFLYKVKTYKNQRAWDSNVHPLLTTANSTTIRIGNKISVMINKFSMKRVIVRFAGLPEIVTMSYPLPQSLQSITKNVESLKPIQ